MRRFFEGLQNEGRTQIPLSSPATVGPLARIQDRLVYFDIKICNNAEINHIMVSFNHHYNALLTDSPQKLKSEKIHGTWIILFYVSVGSPQLQRLLFLLKTLNTTTLQQVTGGNTPNLVLKRMLRYFLKTLPLKKILQFQDRICSCIKNTKNNLFSKSLVGKHLI